MQVLRSGWADAQGRWVSREERMGGVVIRERRLWCDWEGEEWAMKFDRTRLGGAGLASVVAVVVVPVPAVIAVDGVVDGRVGSGFLGGFVFTFTFAAGDGEKDEDNGNVSGKAREPKGRATFTLPLLTRRESGSALALVVVF